MDKENIYITTAIDYVNGQPHIGHALEKVQADVLARFYRQQGKRVLFLTGTDEHGSKIAETAAKVGISPQELADKNSNLFKKLLVELNISNDDFIRTSDEKRHWPAVKKMWELIFAQGDLVKKDYQGLYCVGCESFLTEKDLVDGKCQYHNKEPEKITERNYFFNLGKYSSQIIDKITNNEFNIVPQSRKNEILNILKQGYQEVSFSRPKEKLSWGIPVPDDNEQVMYVWCDALTNYISALGFADSSEKFEMFWNNANVIHIIGKDILRFHAAIWPAMLFSAGLKLPGKLFTHGFITSAGKKMSKSLGNIVDPFDIIDKYGTDSVRYYLLREIPSTNDGDITINRFEELYSSDLANGLGNLVSRVTNMIANYLDGTVELNGQSEFNWERINEYTESLQYDKALYEIWAIIDQANKMIDDVKPWKLAKSDTEQDKLMIKEHLNTQAIILRDIAIVLQSYLPSTAEKILNFIQASKITKAEPLFPRLN